MVVINPRLEPIFKAFCKNHCKHRIKKQCELLFDKPALILCPIGEWWDLNDYLNEIRGKIDKIQTLIHQRHSK